MWVRCVRRCVTVVGCGGNGGHGGGGVSECHRQALDGKELARSRQDICHTRKLQDEGSRPNVREEVGRHAAPVPCAERHTRDSLLCVAIHAQCVEEEEERFRAQHMGRKKKKSIANSREAEATQLQGRVDT